MNRADQVVQLLKTRGGAKLPEICGALDITRGNASRILADLVTARRVSRTGERRNYVYVAVKPGILEGRASSVFDLAT